MKRLLATVTLICALSFPAFAGHVMGDSYAACSCGTPMCVEDYPGECSGHNGTQQNTSSNLGSESLMILTALLLWLKFRT